MGKGRPPKPTETKKAQGNRGKRKLPENVLVAGRELPDPPEHMRPGAREVWADVVPMLADAGVLDKVDGLALEVLCEAVELRRLAADILQRGNGTGLVIVQPSGRVAPDPHFTVWKDASTVVRQFAEQFGLSPSARARLGGAGVQAASPAAVDPDIGPSPRLRALDGGKA